MPTARHLNPEATSNRLVKAYTFTSELQVKEGIEEAVLFERLSTQYVIHSSQKNDSSSATQRNATLPSAFPSAAAARAARAAKVRILGGSKVGSGPRC